MVGIAPRADFQAAAHPAQIFSGVGGALGSAHFAFAKANRAVGKDNELSLFHNLFRHNYGSGGGNRFAFHPYQFNTNNIIITNQSFTPGGGDRPHGALQEHCLSRRE